MQEVTRGRSSARPMRHLVWLIAALCIALTALLGLSAEPARARDLALLPHAGQPLAVAGTAQPTWAWLDFCNQLPAECEIDPTEAPTITLTPETWRTLLAVNATVNAAIKPLTDRDHWHAEDRWDYPADGYGDCEDYQILKRKVLAAAGLPRRALRMTVVLDEEAAGHAVLMVRTDRGEFILDNKRDAVLLWEQTGYIYIKREGDAGPAWVSLDGLSAPMATATN
jgi:predicted transglutaminase-like cysteine proteinase